MPRESSRSKSATLRYVPEQKLADASSAERGRRNVGKGPLDGTSVGRKRARSVQEASKGSGSAEQAWNRMLAAGVFAAGDNVLEVVHDSSTLARGHILYDGTIVMPEEFTAATATTDSSFAPPAPAAAPATDAAVTSDSTASHFSKPHEFVREARGMPQALRSDCVL